MHNFVVRAKFNGRVSLNARGNTFARGHFCTATLLHKVHSSKRGHFCTRGLFCQTTLLHGGSLLHEGTFLHGVTFARRHFYTSKFLHSVTYCSTLHSNGDTFARRILLGVYFHGSIYSMRKF